MGQNRTSNRRLSEVTVVWLPIWIAVCLLIQRKRDFFEIFWVKKCRKISKERSLYLLHLKNWLFSHMVWQFILAEPSPFQNKPNSDNLRRWSVYGSLKWCIVNAKLTRNHKVDLLKRVYTKIQLFISTQLCLFYLYVTQKEIFSKMTKSRFFIHWK